MRIAVIGAGLTGLVAARDLAARGHAVTIYEKGKTAGGLAAGFDMHGTSLEKAYHHIFKTDADIIDLTRELGLEDRLEWHPGSIGIWHGGAFHPFATPLDLLRFRPLRLHDRLRAGFAVYYLQKTKAWHRFESVSAAEWLRRWCGPNVCKVLWEPLLRGKFHARAEDVSMAWLWARLHTRGNSKEKGERREKLGYYRGGFQVLVDALLAGLSSQGVPVHLEADVQGVRRAEDGVVVARADADELFDRVLCTVPSSAFAHLLGDGIGAAYRAQLQSIGYLGAACLVFSTPQSLLPYYWTNIHDLASPFLVLIQHTNLTGTAPYGGRHVYYLGTYVEHDDPLFTAPEEQVASAFFAQLRRLCPSFDPALAETKHLFRFSNAQHVVDRGYAERIPAYRTPVPGVYLANFSQIFPEDRGTNFAVREGRKVAALMEEDAR